MFVSCKVKTKLDSLEQLRPQIKQYFCLILSLSITFSLEYCGLVDVIEGFEGYLPSAMRRDSTCAQSPLLPLGTGTNGCIKVSNICYEGKVCKTHCSLYRGT